MDENGDPPVILAYPDAPRHAGPLALLPPVPVPGTNPGSAPGEHRERGPRRWPLAVIAAPASMSIWAGWVQLGGMCGFGEVQPFPGIVDWHLDTAITLPVGVEAYGAYALGLWLSAGTPERARRWASASAVGSLVLGMLGQVAYHLLAAAGRTRAPWEVTVIVSCMPVIVVGCAAALMHLAGAAGIASAPGDGPASTAASTGQASPDTPSSVPAGAVPAVSGGAPWPVPAAVAPDAPASAPASAPAGAHVSAHVSALADTPPAALRAVPAAAVKRARGVSPGASRDTVPEKRYAAESAAGSVPSLRRIMREMKVGQQRAAEIKAALADAVAQGAVAP